MPYPASVRYSAVGNVDSASYKQELAKDSENSEMDTDSEPEDSESDDDDSSQQSFHSTSRGSGANSSVMKRNQGPTYVIWRIRIIPATHARRDLYAQNIFDATSELSIVL